MSLINRIKTAAAVLFGTALLWTAPASCAGTLPIAQAQQHDLNGQPVLCQVRFFVAGTVSTPQNSYSDFGLSLNPNPVLQCDQTGRVPMFWLADGLVHVQMIDGAGLSIIDTTMQVLGPSSGGGGGGATVDPTTIAATGDLKWRLDKSPISGWVRINGLTIGSATSGATERANADAQNLFVYIWTTFSQPSGNVICPVVGGLGATALADFNANKQITLEDARARSLFALDDMGNSALGGFAGVAFTQGNATTAGSSGGKNSTTLLNANLPPYRPTGTSAITVGGVPAIVPPSTASTGSASSPGTVVTIIAGNFASPIITLNADPQGGTSTPIPSVPSALLGSLFWKL